jgi:hypothetical protein
MLLPSCAMHQWDKRKTAAGLAQKIDEYFFMFVWMDLGGGEAG